jgi:hypothetical protein
MMGSSVSLSCGKLVEEPKRSRNMSAIWLVEGEESSAEFFSGGIGK